MSVPERTYTVAEFDEFVQLPENGDKLFEYIGGEMFEVPSRLYDSSIAARISANIVIFLQKHDLGYVTGEGAGYMVCGERYVPNAAFIRYDKVEDLHIIGYVPNPPDLVVEMLSYENVEDNKTATIKLGNYLAAGVVVWIVRPEKKMVEVHQPGKPVRIFHEKDTLDGGDVLPGLSIKLGDIFK